MDYDRSYARSMVIVQVTGPNMIFHFQVMLDEFGAQIENAESKLDATMRKMVS